MNRDLFHSETIDNEKFRVHRFFIFSSQKNARTNTKYLVHVEEEGEFSSLQGTRSQSCNTHDLTHLPTLFTEAVKETALVGELLKRVSPQVESAPRSRCRDT